MSECWHYIRFGIISDDIITGMHCTVLTRVGEPPHISKRLLLLLRDFNAWPHFLEGQH